MRQLRVGVVGLGVMGHRHLRTVHGVDAVQLIGAADTGLAGSVIAGAPVVGSVSELLAIGLDLCVISTPSASHVACAVQWREPACTS